MRLNQPRARLPHQIADSDVETSQNSRADEIKGFAKKLKHIDVPEKFSDAFPPASSGSRVDFSSSKK